MITEYVGVYHADGGIVGEAKYVVGHLLGRVHCALCDITHSPVRRKKAWDQLVAELGVPFRLYHLNEMPPDVADVVAQVGSPVVLARSERALHVLFDRDALAAMDGSVPGFAQALRSVGSESPTGLRQQREAGIDGDDAARRVQ
jgi:hypothetical protein